LAQEVIDLAKIQGSGLDRKIAREDALQIDETKGRRLFGT
jgi:hypothetical protein